MQLPSAFTTPSREKANQPDPQVWLICNTKNNYFLCYCQSEAETILNREAKSMNYEQTLEYIHAVQWAGHKPGLTRTRTLLALSLIHI